MLNSEVKLKEELANQVNIDFAWYVGATGNNDAGQWSDFAEEYIEQGIWINRWDNNFIDVVKSIKVGDRIVIKSAFNQKNNLPFESYGKMVAVMRIKAIGIVTENIGDGNKIKVNWTKVEPEKNWYGQGSLQQTIHRVSAKDSEIKKQLLAFTFGNVPQDFTMCENYYANKSSELKEDVETIVECYYEVDDINAPNDKFMALLKETLFDETLDNKKWIFSCLEKLKEYKALDEDTLDKLTDFNFCNTMFKLYHTPVLISVIDENTANRVYPNDKFVLNGGKEFFVSKEWYNNPSRNTKSQINRILFSNWVIKQIEHRFRTLNYNTNVTSEHPLNRIIFGAPGTGKSYKLLTQTEGLIGKGRKPERVTFHPDYTYANFVGCYKPVPAKDEDGKDIITYKYVPGPFMRMLVKALLEPEQAHLLIVEEINRANVAAVFGDVFQLLDRDKNGVSEYEIQTSEDMRWYLSEALSIDVSKVESIKIPNNLFLWATMNSADQGVYPMDTAFKRRWDFEYIGIDDGEDKMKDFEFNVQNKVMKWNDLRVAINNALTNAGINEDKLLGPFFIDKNILDAKDNDKFIKAFCNKVIMYLFEDAARTKRKDIFAQGENKLTYSKLCADFKTKGIDIFVDDIKKAVNVTEKQDDNVNS